MNPEQLEQLIDGLLRDHGAALRLYAATWSAAPDDCVQNALIKLATSDPKPDNTLAWLYRVVRNEAISRSRSERRRRRREKLVASSKPLFQASFRTSLDTQQLEASLAELKPELREVVVAKIWGELTFEQIAESIGCSSSAAHRRYQSGLEQLREILERYERRMGQGTQRR